MCGSALFEPCGAAFCRVAPLQSFDSSSPSRFFFFYIEFNCDKKNYFFFDDKCCNAVYSFNLLFSLDAKAALIFDVPKSRIEIINF